MKFKIIPNEQTPEVKEFKDALSLIKYNKKMILKFLAFAKNKKSCCGLAANQVSLDGERIMERFFVIKFNHWWDIIICPEILEYKGSKKEQKEGCLTWIGKTIIAERFPEIKVRYYNINGEIKERNISGFEAQIWQHEYNHLMGVEEKII